MGHVSQLEFRHIESFLMLCEERHFGRAANRLFISQPAMSHRIRRLEAALGTQLVSHEPGKLLLTPAGERFANEARHLWSTALACVGALAIGPPTQRGGRSSQPSTAPDCPKGRDAPDDAADARCSTSGHRNPE